MELVNISNELDFIFAHYLELLDEYDLFRKKLSTLQASVQQNLARANFNARGIRYGEELYDARMQASRFSFVTEDEKGIPVFTIGHLNALKKSYGDTHSGDCSDDTGRKGGEKRTENTSFTSSTLTQDPIRMFGILIPPQLRRAQVDSIKMVEEVIPKLVGLTARMSDVEAKISALQKYRDRMKSKDCEQGNIDKDSVDLHV